MLGEGGNPTFSIIDVYARTLGFPSLTTPPAQVLESSDLPRGVLWALNNFPVACRIFTDSATWARHYCHLLGTSGASPEYSCTLWMSQCCVLDLEVPEGGGMMVILYAGG